MHDDEEGVAVRGGVIGCHKSEIVMGSGWVASVQCLCWEIGEGDIEMMRQRDMTKKEQHL